MSGRPRALSDKQVAWAFEKWHLGYSMQQIADALYVDRATIFNAFKRLDLAPLAPLKYDFREG